MPVPHPSLTNAACPEVLPQEIVSYPGQPVAVVVAETAAEAEDALDAIRVDYDPLPVAATIEEALRPDAPRVHPEGNIASRFTPHDPAILRMLRDVLAAGAAHGIPVSVCGEMASEPLSAVLLLGLGFTTLSVAPPALPLLKWLVRTVPIELARRAAAQALEAAGPDEVTGILREAIRPVVDLRLIDPLSTLPGRASGASLLKDGG